MQAGEGLYRIECYRLRSRSAKGNRGRQHEGEHQGLPHPSPGLTAWSNSGSDDDCYASARFTFSIASSTSAVFL